MKRLAQIGILGLSVITACSILPAVAQPQPSTPDQQYERDQRVVHPKGTLEEAIKNVQNANLMKGFPDGQFHPEQTMTRAELAHIMVQAFDLKDRERTSRKVVLKDVPSDFWAASDIDRVVNLGVMEGYRTGYFNPNHPITRAEALAVVAQAYGVYQFDESIIKAVLSNYPDANQIPDWARKALATALKAGLIDVQPSEPIRPLQLMTRGEMAFTLNQYLQQLNSAVLPR